jgi:hypothetical protein
VIASSRESEAGPEKGTKHASKRIGGSLAKPRSGVSLDTCWVQTPRRCTSSVKRRRSAQSGSDARRTGSRPVAASEGVAYPLTGRGLIRVGRPAFRPGS